MRTVDNLPGKLPHMNLDRLNSIATALVTAWIGAGSADAVASYRLTEMVVPPAFASSVGLPYVRALNNGGQVIGGLNDAMAFPFVTDLSFSWSTVAGFSVGTAWDKPTGLNNAGQVSVTIDGRTAAWSPGPGVNDVRPLVGVPPPNPGPGQTVSSQATGINDHGAIVGLYTLSSETAPVRQRGLLWASPASVAPVEFSGEPSGYDGLEVAGIGNGGLIAGTVFDLGTPWQQSAAVWSAAQPEDMRLLAHPLQAPGSCRAVDVNDNDQVLGQCSGSAGTLAVLWDADGQGLAIGSFTPVAMNNRGQVIGSDPSGWALLWDAGNGVRRLGDLVDPADPLWTPDGLFGAGGINDWGQIAAVGRVPGDPTTPRVLLLTPVPEPSTAALMLLGGLAGLARIRRSGDSL